MTPPRGQALAGLALAVVGAALALLALLHPAGLRTPAAIVYSAALAFVIAGWILVARAHNHELLKAWLPVALLACMVTPALWLAFGSGRRGCTMTSLSGVLRLLGLGPDLPCRIGFGIAAIVGVALVLLALRQAIRSTRRR